MTLWIQVLFIRYRIADTAPGVVLVHLILTVPYVTYVLARGRRCRLPRAGIEVVVPSRGARLVVISQPLADGPTMRGAPPKPRTTDANPVSRP